MTHEQIAHLRAKAAAGTPGPWVSLVSKFDGMWRVYCAPDGLEGEKLKLAEMRSGENTRGNAAYIAAANPAVVLELLDALAASDAMVVSANNYAADLIAARKAAYQSGAALRARLAKIEEAAKPFAETTDFRALSATCSQADIRALRAVLKETGNGLD